MGRAGPSPVKGSCGCSSLSGLCTTCTIGQAILLRKLVVTRVVCGHGHDGATAVAAQNIVCYPDGHPGTRGWVHSEAACARAPDSTPCDIQLSQGMHKT